MLCMPDMTTTEEANFASSALLPGGSVPLCLGVRPSRMARNSSLLTKNGAFVLRIQIHLCQPVFIRGRCPFVVVHGNLGTILPWVAQLPLAGVGRRLGSMSEYSEHWYAVCPTG